MVGAGKQPALADLVAIAERLEVTPASAGLARQLAGLGLNQRAVCSCFGVVCAGHAPLRQQPPGAPQPPPAAVVPLLFVGGRELGIGLLERRLGATLELLVDTGLVALVNDRARARLTLLPVGDGLVACAPLPALATTPELAGSGRFPDDSSFHLLGALPTQRLDRWLDVGTGNAIVPLARSTLAATITATDVDAEALALARIGRALSGADITIAAANLLAAAETSAPWSLITFNAPLPETAESGLISRFWAEVPNLLSDAGEVIVHCQLGSNYPDELDLPGLTTTLRYTPPGHEPAFGVTMWRPSARPGRRLFDVDLSVAHPHIERRQFARE